MKKGFTLIELLVVIAIIGVLASIVLVSVNSARRKARDINRISVLKQLQLAVEMYYDTQGSYPLSCNGSGSWGGHCPAYGNCDANYIVGLTPDYLSVLPIDPLFDTGSRCYLYLSNGDNYMIIAHGTMETVCDGSDADTTPDPGDDCNSQSIQLMDRVCCEQATIAVYSVGAKNW